MITADVLPYNNMLINPLGPLWSGSQAVCLQEVVATALTRGRHRRVGVRAAWDGGADLGACQERSEQQGSPRPPPTHCCPRVGHQSDSCSIY